MRPLHSGVEWTSSSRGAVHNAGNQHSSRECSRRYCRCLRVEPVHLALVHFAGVLWSPENPIEEVRANVRAGEVETQKLRGDVAVLQKRLDEIKGPISDPGPAPSWPWHPSNYLGWRGQHSLFVKQQALKAAIYDRGQELIRANANLETWKRRLNIAEQKRASAKLIERIWEGVRTVLRILAIPLHFLLLVGVLLFGLKVLLRLALINGWVRATRI